MKYWIIITALLLTGCTTTNVALSPADKPAIGAGTLQIVWLSPNRAEISLDGRRYVGEWSDSRCFTPECRGEFRNVLKHHRKHIRNGAAELVAKDSAHLSCEWVSHDKMLVGTCLAEDGRTYRLHAG